MSADRLREAARLMRERAARSIGDEKDTPRWVAAPTIDPDNDGWYVAHDWPDADWDTTVAHLPYDYEGDTAAHVASWPPVVALAVADWLDGQANLDVLAKSLGARGLDPATSHAHMVADAYLGTPQTAEPVEASGSA